MMMYFCLRRTGAFYTDGGREAGFGRNRRGGRKEGRKAPGGANGGAARARERVCIQLEERDVE